MTLRIALISTVASPVREKASGSVEGLVWLLARGLSCMGHEVTVFGAGGSETHGEVVATLPGPYASPDVPYDWQLCEWINLCHAVEHSERFDVLHSHAYLWGTPLHGVSRAPMVHSMHVSPYENDARLWRLTPDACVTAISRYQWSAYPELRPMATIYHGIDPAQYTLRREPEDYLCYLGRFIPGKGPLLAISVAHELGMRLLLAGPRNPYYRQQIEPLVDGRSVEYVGYVSGAEKDRLLGGARALLYPVRSPEPFGLVLIEAMMCGTPVAAISLGAVPEIVDEGVTGYCVDSAHELGQAALDSLQLDRARVRDRAEARFSAERMTADYARLYQRLALADPVGVV